MKYFSKNATDSQIISFANKSEQSELSVEYLV
jgi:hypothetical protein